MIELEPLGGVHGHHLHGRCPHHAHGLLFAQSRFGHGGEVAGEVACGGLRLTAHVGAGQLGQLGDVAQSLDGVRLGCEHLLAAQPDPLDQAQHEGVGAAVVEGAGGGAVEAQERARPVAALLGELRALERGRNRARHVELAPAGELCEPRHVDGAQLDGWTRERPHHCAGVIRVRQRTQPGEHVAHLGALEVGGGAAGAGRHRALLERRGNRRALGLDGADEHADLGRRSAGCNQLLRLGGHRLRLCALCVAAPEAHAPAARPLQLLGDPLGRGCHDRHGRLEDSPARAVVVLEAHDLRVRELALEVEQVLLRGAAEAVDGLVVVAHDRDVAVLLHEQPQQHPLREVRVLVLVDEHVAEAPRHPLAHVRALVQQAERPQDQVAEVERPALREQPVVIGVQAGELALALRPGARGVAARLRGEPVRVAAVVVGGDHLVLEAIDPRHEAGEQRRGVAANLVVAQGQVVDALEQKGEPVGRGHRGEEGVDAGLERLVLQQARAERVEGRHMQLLVGRLDERLEPLAHLGRGGRREGEREDRVGRHPLLDEPGEAAGERARLAGPGARHHHERAARVGDGLLLRAVEAV